MRFIQIPKKAKGEFRKICIPHAEEKVKLRNYLSNLNKKAATLCGDNVQGFMVGRSPVTNAKKHIGKRFTLKFDLADFFDTVTPDHLKGILTKDELTHLMPDDRAYQGLPTSPIVANLAAIKMDDAIQKMLEKQKIDVVYTRYADDLCFSFDDHNVVKILKTFIPQIVGRCKFKLNKSKTWLQDSKFGKRHVTGVMVGDEGISSSREVRRRLRAAIHQKNFHEAKGLTEWTKLKEPNPNRQRLSQYDMNELTRMWRLPRIYINSLPKKPADETYQDAKGNTVLITGDHIQVLGLSNFTTNWGSCMTHPGGQYHRHAAFWTYLEGTRIAGLLSGETKTFGPFTRPTFKARALIHTFRDGTTFYDRIYQESMTAGETLTKILEANNIKYVVNRASIQKMRWPYGKPSILQYGIVGSVSEKLVRDVPYFDNLENVSYDDSIYCF